MESDCLKQGELEGYTAGKLSPADRERIEQHIAACQSCADRYRRLRSDDAWLEGVRKVIKPEPGDPGDGGEPASANVAETQSASGVETEIFHTPTIPGYELVKEAHCGGQGVVYQAIQKSTKRRVAIKVMHEGPFAGPPDKARFEREVQVLGQLNHPNIVAIHDSGTAAGSFYYVMDYISGRSLDDYITLTKPSIDDALRLFAKICDAVNAAHLRGVIHRDLKPSNIRIDADGELRTGQQ